MIVLLFPDLIFLCLALQGTPDLDDQDLVLRIKQGDAGAFKSFFDRHHGSVFGFLRARNVPSEVCEDLIQNAFVAIWERRTQLDEHQSLRAYLFRTCYNRALNHFRDTAKFAGDAELDRAETRTTPDHHTEYVLMTQTLRDAIAALPERRRAVFELCFLQELTYRETAAVLDISVKTVEHQMGHALKAMRKALKPFL